MNQDIHDKKGCLYPAEIVYAKFDVFPSRTFNMSRRLGLCEGEYCVPKHSIPCDFFDPENRCYLYTYAWYIMNEKQNKILQYLKRYIIEIY